MLDYEFGLTAPGLTAEQLADPATGTALRASLAAKLGISAGQIQVSDTEDLLSTQHQN
jgi:hypothetical protein